MLRRYAGVVRGGVRDDDGPSDAPLGRNFNNRTKYCVLSGGRRAVTHYKVLGRYAGYTFVEFTLETGRTHQIRVHMAHIGHPVAGDALYGAPPIKALNGQCLHAKTLGFTHPVTRERLEFTSNLPRYFEEFLNMVNLL
jgi:23S rRNA pseudouridine1911/1915/1917 synthase